VASTLLLISFLSLLAVFAVVLVGMFVMLQMIRLDAVAVGAVRALFVVLTGILALYLARCVVLPMLISLLVWLRQSLFWFVIAGLALIAVAISIAAKRVRSHQHETNDE
jgi:hypothetical protein